MGLRLGVSITWTVVSCQNWFGYDYGKNMSGAPSGVKGLFSFIIVSDAPAGSTWPILFNQNSYPRSRPGERTVKEACGHSSPGQSPSAAAAFSTDFSQLRFSSFTTDSASHKTLSPFRGTEGCSDSGPKALASSGVEGAEQGVL